MFHRLTAAALIAGFLLVPTQAQASTTCQEVAYPVSVAGLAQTMAGTLCVPTDARTIQVLVPGGLYNSAYWDITAYLLAEAPFYAPAARLVTYVLPGYGHALNYAPNAPDRHAAVVAWADRMVGR